MNQLGAELSHAINAEARRQYPKIARQLGTQTLLTAVAPRLALRLETPYPYKLAESDELLPSAEDSFGRLIRRPRKDGLREIHGSISEQTKEHKWLFIPSNNIWIDSTLSAEEASVDADQYVHILLSHLFPEVEAVHTHPDATVKQLAQDEPWAYSDNYLLEAAQPSVGDLINHGMMVARTAPGSHQVSSVVSHFGVTTFSLTGNVNEGLRTEAYDRIIEDSSDPMSAIRYALGRMSAHVLHRDDSPAISVQFEPID